MPTELVDARIKRRLILLEKLIPDPNPGPTDDEILNNFVAGFTDDELEALANATAGATLQARWAECPRRAWADYSDLSDDALDWMIENLQSAN